MNNNDNKNHRLPKRTRLTKVNTVDDLLTRDDINGMLADLNNLKKDIDDLIIIYTDKGRNYWFQITEGTLISTAIWMLESTKVDLLHDDFEE